MNFEINNLYRHRDTIDIDLYIVNIVDFSQDRIVLEVKYWNRHWKCFQGTVDTVEIKRQGYDSWVKL